MIGDNWSRPMGLPVGEPDMRDAELTRLRAEAESAINLLRERDYAATKLYSQNVALRSRVEALEKALRDLLQDTQHAEHHCVDDDCPVKQARAILAGETTQGREG